MVSLPNHKMNANGVLPLSPTKWLPERFMKLTMTQYFELKWF